MSDGSYIDKYWDPSKEYQLIFYSSLLVDYEWGSILAYFVFLFIYNTNGDFVKDGMNKRKYMIAVLLHENIN